MTDLPSELPAPIGDYVKREAVLNAFAELARDLQKLPPRARMNRLPQLIRELREKL